MVWDGGDADDVAVEGAWPVLWVDEDVWGVWCWSLVDPEGEVDGVADLEGRCGRGGAGGSGGNAPSGIGNLGGEVWATLGRGRCCISGGFERKSSTFPNRFTPRDGLPTVTIVSCVSKVCFDSGVSTVWDPLRVCEFARV